MYAFSWDIQINRRTHTDDGILDGFYKTMTALLRQHGHWIKLIICGWFNQLADPLRHLSGFISGDFICRDSVRRSWSSESSPW